MNAAPLKFADAQRADAEAAKLYEEFVESFGDAGQAEGKTEPRAFVRGGTIQPGSSAAAAIAAGAPPPPLALPQPLNAV